MSGARGPADPRSGWSDDLADIAEALEAPGGRAVFVRGLTLGALAGAALVGAVIQLRRRPATRRRSAGDRPEA